MQGREPAIEAMLQVLVLLLVLNSILISRALEKASPYDSSREEMSLIEL